MSYWTVAKMAFTIAAGAGLALAGVSALRKIAGSGLASFFGGLTEPATTNNGVETDTGEQNSSTDLPQV